MFELAARLVGVYKVNHMTKSVTIENKDYVHRRAGPVKQQAHAQGQQQTQQQVHHQQSHNPLLHKTQNKGLSEGAQERLQVQSSSSNSSLAYRLKTNA